MSWVTFLLFLFSGRVYVRLELFFLEYLAEFACEALRAYFSFWEGFKILIKFT